MNGRRKGATTRYEITEGANLVDLASPCERRMENRLAFLGFFIAYLLEYSLLLLRVSSPQSHWTF